MILKVAFGNYRSETIILYEFNLILQVVILLKQECSTFLRFRLSQLKHPYFTKEIVRIFEFVKNVI